MSLYAFGDLLVDSDLPLPELIPAGGSRADSRLRLLVDSPSFDTAESIFESKLDDGRTWMVCARHEEGYLLRFVDLAIFTVSFDGRRIALCAAEGAPAETLRHLFLDHVFPLSLSLGGELALHAAATVTSSGAAAFVGDTGEGKSTLTASFAQSGFPPLSDDCLVVREHGGDVFAIPSYPGLRLWPDAVSSLAIDAAHATAVAHYSDKQRVLMTNASAGGPVPLRRVYVLAPNEAATGAPVVVELLSRRDGVVELLKHAYRIEVRERDAIAAEWDRVDRVCQRCGVRRLSYPRAFATLPAVREAVVEDLRRG